MDLSLLGNLPRLQTCPLFSCGCYTGAVPDYDEGADDPVILPVTVKKFQNILTSRQCYVAKEPPE